jgi:hypothetical protein
MDRHKFKGGIYITVIQEPEEPLLTTYLLKDYNSHKNKLYSSIRCLQQSQMLTSLSRSQDAVGLLHLPMAALAALLCVPPRLGLHFIRGVP